MQRKIIPDVVKRQTISSLKPDNTAFEAASMMTKANIGAVVILDPKGGLIGIVTERDMTRRVIAKGVDAKTTRLADIMTKNPDTLSPDDSANDALELMQARRYRHLPVVEDGKLYGMISAGDILASEVADQQATIEYLHEYLYGRR